MTWDEAEGGPWATTRARLAVSGRLHAQGLLDEVPCLACGLPTLSERGGKHICVVCHWKDDDSTRDQPDRPSWVNHGLTLRQAAAHIVETGVYASPSWEWTVPEYFTPRARAARAQLVKSYERLMMNPRDASARKDVHDGRSSLMYAIVSAMQ